MFNTKSNLLFSITFEFVSDLTSSLASSKLPFSTEAIVPVNSDSLSVEQEHVEAINSKTRLLSIVVLYKAESTRLESLVVKPHVQVLDVAHLAEQSEKLRLLSIKT